MSNVSQAKRKMDNTLRRENSPTSMVEERALIRVNAEVLVDREG